MAIDRSFQRENNGPLTRNAQSRIETVREHFGMTLAQIGKRFDLSGPFMSQLLRGDTPARIRSKHIPRIRAALEQLEVEAGIQSPSAPTSTTNSAIATIEDLIRAAHRLGFEVSFKPLDR